MSRSCQRATFSSPTSEAARNDAGQPTDALGHDRVALVRHRRGAFWPLPNGFLHPRAPRCGRVADLERELVQRGGAERERGEQLRVAIALDDLGRGRRRLKPEAAWQAISSRRGSVAA